MTKVAASCLFVALLARTYAFPPGIPIFEDHSDPDTDTDIGTDTDTDTDAEECHVKLGPHASHEGNCGRTLRTGHTCSQTPEDGFVCAESKCLGDTFHAGVCTADGKCQWGDCTYILTMRISFDTKNMLSEKQLSAIRTLLAASINVGMKVVHVSRFESGDHSSMLVSISGLPYGTANRAVDAWGSLEKLQTLLASALVGYAKIRSIDTPASIEPEDPDDSGGGGDGSGLKGWQAALIAVGVTGFIFVAVAMIYKRRTPDKSRYTIADSLLENKQAQGN